MYPREQGVKKTTWPSSMVLGRREPTMFRGKGDLITRKHMQIERSRGAGCRGAFARMQDEKRKLEQMGREMK